MKNVIELKVHIAEDEESGRWYVAESDIPGLRLEADDALTLIERLREAAPELIEMNKDEIIAAHLGEPEAEPWATRRPSIKPIFDTPLSLACA
ncbi:DUF1902 domain-containing protein [Novosphingobium pokkalii]|uniref:DUF1902 domain-containing protein n=1 Tax=Novosphingobium pokkalii TaxID=1770194 RepID=A0ABV7V0X5_9SPHN|nr:DUF1902 domain-containing protein [Novosphingobium pokkalii]GHC82236.1 hypothetical protein GCM10019060_00690 [Novosphingobium pokkalii]